VASPRELLEKARTVLLVDWPSTAVPRALLEARLAVFGFSPGGYSVTASFASGGDHRDLDIRQTLLTSRSPERSALLSYKYRTQRHIEQ
jgi:hypothetical protein